MRLMIDRLEDATPSMSTSGGEGGIGGTGGIPFFFFDLRMELLSLLPMPWRLRFCSEWRLLPAWTDGSSGSSAVKSKLMLSEGETSTSRSGDAHSSRISHCEVKQVTFKLEFSAQFLVFSVRDDSHTQLCVHIIKCQHRRFYILHSLLLRPKIKFYHTTTPLVKVVRLSILT